MGGLPTMKLAAALFLAVLAFQNLPVRASDPELTTDFKVPDGANASALNGTFFTFTRFRNFQPNASVSPIVSAVIADFVSFPALDGLGISPVLLSLPPGTVNPPHTHPRASELNFVIKGTIDIGFVDTTDKLRTQTLQDGDLFIVPKGLVHFQINRYQDSATILNFFSSSGPGLVRTQVTLFGSGIPDDVLEKSFSVPADVIRTLTNAQSSSGSSAPAPAPAPGY